MAKEFDGKKPAYDFAAFRKACCAKQNVNILRKVSDDAKVFYLNTREDILDFFCNEGFTNMKFQNRSLGRRHPFKNLSIDAYEFHYGQFTKGYFAFYFVEGTKQWVIKSLHESDDSSFPFRTMLKNEG